MCAITEAASFRVWLFETVLGALSALLAIRLIEAVVIGSALGNAFLFGMAQSLLKTAQDQRAARLEKPYRFRPNTSLGLASDSVLSR
jgi:hypothetical protein